MLTILMFQTEERSPKMLKLERGNTASKISFDDTMDIERPGRSFTGHDEPDSNDEDDERERYRVEIVPADLVNSDSMSQVSSDRRKMFAKSKSTCYSMPVPVRYEIFSEMTQIIFNTK